MIKPDDRNDMTERHARTLWCPFARLGDAESTYNRGSALVSDEQLCPCIASRCAAWRRTTTDDDDDEVGRCGLAR